jgi:hypothetical protein
MHASFVIVRISVDDHVGGVDVDVDVVGAWGASTPWCACVGYLLVGVRVRSAAANECTTTCLGQVSRPAQPRPTAPARKGYRSFHSSVTSAELEHKAPRHPHAIGATTATKSQRQRRHALHELYALLGWNVDYLQTVRRVWSALSPLRVRIAAVTAAHMLCAWVCSCCRCSSTECAASSSSSGATAP